MMFGRRSNRSSVLPVVVLGAGVDGLAAAIRLAKGGNKVRVLESSDRVGGLFAAEEFEPGFHSTGFLHDDSTIPTSLMASLGLEEHGLQLRDTAPSCLATERDGPGQWIHADVDRMAYDLHQRDANASREWRKATAFIARIRPTVRHLLNDAPAELQPDKNAEKLELLWKGLRLRNLGEADMLELMRVAPMCAADWVREFVLNERTAAAIMHPALIGSWLAPWAAGSAALVLARECMRGSGAVGGPASVVRAMESAARAAGVDIQTGDGAAEITIDGDHVIGVRTASGESIETGRVLSTLEVRRTLLDLCSSNLYGPELHDMLRGWRTRGTTAKLDLALESALDWGPLPAGEPAVTERANTSESIEELERSFDAIKYREMPEHMTLDISITGGAPTGASVASVLVHSVPYLLEGGWTAEAKQMLETRALDALEQVSPGAREKIRAVRTTTPQDIEDRYGMPGGQVFAGEPALDQLYLLRPARRLSRYQSPISGLWIAGGSTHPGPLAPGASGWIASGSLMQVGTANSTSSDHK